MPFTPYHWGPSSWIGLLLFKVLDFPALLISSVIVDVEPFCVLVFRLNYPLHGFLHSFLGGAIVAILLATALFCLRNPIIKVMKVVKLDQRSSFRKIVLTSFIGVYLHILLDAPLYTDIKPFYPLEINPFYGLFSSYSIYTFCRISFVIGIIFYLYRLFAQRTQK